MRLWIIAVLLLCFGCGVSDPPCPPGAMDVPLGEADEALERWARRKHDEKNDTANAVSFSCGYDRQPDGSYRAVDIVWTIVDDVLTCASDPRFSAVPFTNCLNGMARTRFVTRTLGATDAAAALQLAANVHCVELGRAVDIDATKHGLERSGSSQWVPAFIWAVIQAAETMPVPSPTMFMIVPRKSGVEEACVDIAIDAPKRCTASGDCQPEGATGTDAGVVLPPGTTPGDTGGSGDYP